MKCIQYAEGYKYQLRRTYVDTIGIKPAHDIRTAYIDLTVDGVLTIRGGYAWDGPSGPTIDTDTFMRGSLVHDALYQLMREGHLDMDQRQPADQILRDICQADGMWMPRRWWVYHGLRFGGGPAADPAALSPDRLAPAGCTCEMVAA
jgi:hypothetical protein